MIRSRISGILAWAAAAILAGCVEQATETTNPPGLNGRLVDGHGRPVAGASVQLYRVESVPLRPSAGSADSARTDAQGLFNIREVAGGEYNVLGSYNDGGLVVLIPEVTYDSAFVSVDLGTHTLRLPGQIKGQVTEGGAGKAGIFCYVPGTSFLSISDDQGKFWIYNVPEGTYEVGYGYPGLETLVDSGVVVRSGEITELAPRAIGPDPDFPPPAPAARGAVYDTLNGTAVLRWPPAAVPDLDGYVVYRVDSASATPVRVSAGLVRDTVFRDTLYRDPWDTLPRRVTYRVKSQDRDANLSATFSPSAFVDAVPPGLLHPAIGLAVKTPFGDTVVMADTVRLIATYASALRGLAALTWTVDGDTVRTARPGGKTGSDTLVHAFARAGLHRVAVDIVDEGAAHWRDSLDVAVLQDAPEAHAGREAAIAPGVPTVLTGRGVDRFGGIVQYAWDFDRDGSYDDSSALTGEVTRTYPTAGSQSHVLRVRDDDGNHGYDTLYFSVGSALYGELITSDLHLKRSGSPYFVEGHNVLTPGTIMTVDPGVTLRFAEHGRFTIRGTLICEGTRTDSIHMVAAVDSTRLPGEGFPDPLIQFEGGHGSVVRDTTHLSGSRLRYVRFRALKGIGMDGTVVTIEDCTFRQVAASSLNGTNLAVISLATGAPDNDRWIFRRNSFLATYGVAVFVMLHNSYPSFGHPGLQAYITGNSIAGTNGIAVHSLRFTQGLVAIEDNEIRLSGVHEYETAVGIQYEGLRPTRIRNNLISGAATALQLSNTANVEIAHNEFADCARIWQDEGYKGRFHHNRVGAGRLSMTPFQVQGAQYDSNTFDTGIRLSWDDGQSGKPVKPLDFRSNYWSTTDLMAIRQALGMTVRPESVLLEPILSAPAPGAGRIPKPAASP